MNKIRCGCGKYGFLTEEDAVKKLNSLRERKDRPKEPKRVYRCPRSGLHHLTSQSIYERTRK